MPEQIIKLWEEAGYEIKSCTKRIFEVRKEWTEEVNGYKFYTVSVVSIAYGKYFYIKGDFPNECIQLLIKTLKALEVKDE